MEISVTREDLAVLVAMLQHEHFPYNDRGAAGARALKALEAAIVCSCETKRRHEHPSFGGVLRDPVCPIHGDGVLKDGPGHGV